MKEFSRLTDFVVDKNECKSDARLLLSCAECTVGFARPTLFSQPLNRRPSDHW